MKTKENQNMILLKRGEISHEEGRNAPQNIISIHRTERPVNWCRSYVHQEV